MIDITLPNIITIALISVAAVVGVNYLTKMTGISVPGFAS